jgi:2-methylcitrate dehydratase PrpD
VAHNKSAADLIWDVQVNEKGRKIVNNIAEQLSNFLCDAGYDDLPKNIVQETKRVILDSIGCAIGGSLSEVGKISIQLAERLGGAEESTIFGANKKVSCSNAAFANGELINALDYDGMSTGHDIPTILSASLAMAECENVSGKDLILSTALGLEISGRVNAATGGKIGGFGFTANKDSKSVTAGQAVSGYAYSVFGASASCGKILKLNPKEMSNALGVAGYLCMPNVLTKMQHTSPIRMSKYGIFGWGAQGGVTSALLASIGFDGDTEVFEGEHGFWNFVGYRNWDPKRVTEGLGKRWSYEISYKQYPAGT